MRIKAIRPIWIVLFIVVALVLWLASGMLGSDRDMTAESTPASQPAANDKAAPVDVSARVSTAEPVQREARLNGRTAPDRAVTLRAQTAGRIQSVEAKRGSRVAANEVLLRLEIGDRASSRAEARAKVKQRLLSYEAVQKMSAKGYQTRTDLAQAKSDLEAARAQLANVQDDIDDTVIRAPFAGVLETRPVELGDYVGVGDEVARVIQQDPFVIKGNLSEQDVAFVKPGQPGRATLVDGRTLSGTVRYVATEADEATRTYPVELEIHNPDGRLVSGASAKLILPLDTVSAHEVSPDLLSLDEAGDPGVKTVDADNIVHFRAARVVKNESDHLWLGGLPERIRLITAGQGFVRAGDRVHVVADSNAAAGHASQAGADTTRRTANSAPKDGGRAAAGG